MLLSKKNTKIKVWVLTTTPLQRLQKCCSPLSTRLDSLKNSAATVHIIGLTKIAKIEFFPLDWIYCSIRIMMVGPGIQEKSDNTGFHTEGGAIEFSLPSHNFPYSEILKLSMFIILVKIQLYIYLGSEGRLVLPLSVQSSTGYAHNLRKNNYPLQ